jgi:hypothetical protein
MGTSFPLCLHKLELQELSYILEAAICKDGYVLHRCIIPSYVHPSDINLFIWRNRNKRHDTTRIGKDKIIILHRPVY